jgi:hypothetical protein
VCVCVCVWFKNKTLDIALKSPFLKNILELGLVVHICNPRTQVVENEKIMYLNPAWTTQRDSVSQINTNQNKTKSDCL